MGYSSRKRMISRRRFRRCNQINSRKVIAGGAILIIFIIALFVRFKSIGG